MRKSAMFCLVLFTASLCPRWPTQSAESPPQPPKEVGDLAGTYSGTWTSFGINQNGEVVKMMAWTDTMKADRPTVEAGRAYVNTSDEMVFEGPAARKMTIPGREGYLLNENGSLGEYFIESYGQTYRMLKLSNNAWSYAVPASAQELAPMGFSNVAFAQHVAVKVVTVEDGVETHRITRITTVNWKDKDGTSRWLQFVSLQGVHKRQQQG